MMATTPEDKKSMREYAESHHRCAVCWWSRWAWGRKLEVHHITGRLGRGCHGKRNLIVLCDRCHEAIHKQVALPWRLLTRGHILTAKREEDGRVHVKFLAGLKLRQWLGYDPDPLPQFVLDERIENARR